MYAKLFLIVFFAEIYTLIFSFIGSFPVNENAQFNLHKEYLKKYQEISDNGGWEIIKYGKSIYLGSTDWRIKKIKERLIISGDLADTETFLNDSFDIALENAIKKFQTNHTLKPDGIIGVKTLHELNISVDDRIKQIKINMERWKNSSIGLENIYIIINVAAGKLELINQNISLLNMKVIVGRFDRKTPIFNSSLTTIDFNPYWNIPPGIIEKDIIPKIRKNPSFIYENNMNVYYNSKKINPEIIDWNIKASNKYSYKITQDPGPENPMGFVKFLFPNKYFVYLHDTPSKKLFDKSTITFSSGCIRLSGAIDLAKCILKIDRDWEPTIVDSLIKTGKNLKIDLITPVKIYISYFTTWVNTNGELQFAPDIYKKDNL
jgi:murein L,D-transpeptidase YcbB/YkuD